MNVGDDAGGGPKIVERQKILTGRKYVDIVAQRSNEAFNGFSNQPVVIDEGNRRGTL